MATMTGGAHCKCSRFGKSDASRPTAANDPTQTFESGNLVQPNRPIVLPGPEFKIVVLRFEFHSSYDQFIYAVAIEIAHGQYVVVRTAAPFVFRGVQPKWFECSVHSCKQAQAFISHVIVVSRCGPFALLVFRGDPFIFDPPVN